MANQSSTVAKHAGKSTEGPVLQSEPKYRDPCCHEFKEISKWAKTTLTSVMITRSETNSNRPSLGSKKRNPSAICCRVFGDRHFSSVQDLNEDKNRRRPQIAWDTNCSNYNSVIQVVYADIGHGSCSEEDGCEKRDSPCIPRSQPQTSI